MAFNLFDLGQALNAGAGAVNQYRQQRTLGDLGAKLQSGDFEGAAQTALAAGDVGTGISLLKLGNQRKSDAEVSQILGGLGMTGGVSSPTPAAQPQPGMPPVASNEPRGLRNMNPGNIEAGSFAQSQPGYAGTDGRFAKFDTLEHGVGAQAALLDSYGRKGINTVAGVINRWAPQAENGAATGNYAQFVARKIGVDPNTPIDLSNPETRTRLAYAMGEFENGRPIGPQGGGRPVQVSDASGAIPQSAGGDAAGGNVDALQQRLNVLSGLLARQNLSAGARAAIQAQIENTRNMISRGDRQENLSIQRENMRENRLMRQQQFEAAQQERELRRQERADKMASEAAARNEKLTESQAKNSVYYTENKASNDLLNDPKVLIGGVGGQGAVGRTIAAIPGVGQNLAPETTRNFNQAADNFVSNVVYAKSGASATAAEYDRSFRQYIPNATDGQAQIEQKAAARQRWLDQMKISAGPAIRKSGGGTPKTTGGGSTDLGGGWSVEVHPVKAQ